MSGRMRRLSGARKSDIVVVPRVRRLPRMESSGCVSGMTWAQWARGADLRHKSDDSVRLP